MGAYHENKCQGDNACDSSVEADLIKRLGRYGYAGFIFSDHSVGEEIAEI